MRTLIYLMLGVAITPIGRRSWRSVQKKHEPVRRHAPAGRMLRKIITARKTSWSGLSPGILVKDGG